MTPTGYTEDDLVEQPAIALLAELGRETRAEVILTAHLRPAVAQTDFRRSGCIGLGYFYSRGGRRMRRSASVIKPATWNNEPVLPQTKPATPTTMFIPPYGTFTSFYCKCTLPQCNYDTGYGIGQKGRSTRSSANGSALGLAVPKEIDV